MLEGALRIYWGVQGVIHLKEDDDQRTVVTVRKRNSCKLTNGVELEEPVTDTSLENDTGIESGTDCASETSSSNQSKISPSISSKSMTLPPKLDVKNLEWDELDELLQVERKVEDSNKLYQTMPVPLPSQLNQNHNANNKSPTEESPAQTDSSKSSSEVLNLNGSNYSLDIEYAQEEHNRVISQDDSWIEKGLVLNRSMSGPDCLERIRKSESSDCEDSLCDGASIDDSASIDGSGIV